MTQDKEKIAKNFEKSWKNLSEKEREEIVSFMQDTLDVCCKSYAQMNAKIDQSIIDLEENFNLKDSLQSDGMIKILNMLIRSKVKKEEKLQAKIAKGRDRGILFKDILLSDKALNKAEEAIDELCNKAEQYSVFRKESVEPDKDVFATYCQLRVIKATNDKFSESFKIQEKKVEELFPDYVKGGAEMN